MADGNVYTYGFIYYFHAEDKTYEGLDHLDIIESKKYTKDFKKVIKQLDSVPGIYNPDWLTELENN